MGLAPILLVGPFVAVVGVVAVIFVMRHRSVQEKSMYSARRSQIERKVRAARQRTLAPTGRHSDKDEAVQAEQAFTASDMEAKAAVPTATWGPTARPPQQPPPQPPPPPASPQTWEVGPTVPPPPPSTPPPTPPPYKPSAPPYTPPEPAYSPPEPAYSPSEPAYTPPQPGYTDSTWTPAPAEPFTPSREPEPQVTSPAGAGAAWSIVGETKSPTAETVPDKKSKKEQQAQAGSWQLASGVAPGEDDPGEMIKRPSATLAVAQYAVLVVGLVMVLIGVVVMLANSHVT